MRDKYRKYVATLKQYEARNLTSGYLIIGETYKIKLYNEGDDFSNVILEGSGIGDVNTQRFIFTASGTTPLVWNNSVLGSKGAPIQTILENTLGYTPVWNYDDVGSYYFDFNETIKSSRIIKNINTTNSITDNYSIRTDIIGGFTGTIFDIKELSNGNLLIGGDITEYNFNSATTLYGIVELDSIGNVVNNLLKKVGTGFYSGKSGLPGVKCIKIQSDGKILVGGVFDAVFENEIRYLVRLNADYTIDDTFLINKVNRPILTIDIQSDGKILIGGQFNEYVGYKSNNIIRLNYDGSIDTSFNIGVGTDDQVNKILVQPDGKILVGGQFSGYTSNLPGGLRSMPFLIRYNSDGSVDNEFYSRITSTYPNSFGKNGYGDIDGPVYDIVLQSDGSIILGGHFTPYLMRLDKDGNFDTTFDNNISGFDNDVASILINNDKIYIGGYFTNKFIILDMDGRTNNLYSPLSITGHNINSIIEKDGKIYMGGYFENSVYCLDVSTRFSLNTTNDNVLSDTAIEIKVY